jgi:ribonuclease VapC
VIAIDSSALMTILLDEPEADACTDVLAVETKIVISAATLAEVIIVATRRAVREALDTLLASLPLEVVPVSETDARRAAAAYERWGRGVHPANLNYGDCFSYALAQSRGCPLLFVGNDFNQTDVLVRLP